VKEFWLTAFALLLLVSFTSAWWDTDWGYRKPLILSEGQGSERYLEPLTINVTALKLSTSNCSKELRVTAGYTSESVIPWEVINSTGQTEASGSQWCMIQFLVNMTSAKNASYTERNVTNYWFYYGNAAATSASYGQLEAWSLHYSGDVDPTTEGWRKTSVVETCNSVYFYVSGENNIGNFNDTGVASPSICSFQRWHGAEQPNYGDNFSTEIRMRVISAVGGGSGGVYAGMGITLRNLPSNQYQAGANDTHAGVGDLGNIKGISVNSYLSATTSKFHVYRVVSDLRNNYTAFYEDGVHKFTVANTSIIGDLNDTSFGENSLNYGDQINFEIDYISYLYNASLSPPLSSSFGSEQEEGASSSVNATIATSTNASALHLTNQRKLEYNAIDGSWWGAGLINASCYVFSSSNNGVDWTLTNVSNGDGTDYGCSLTVDDYGNVWSYWSNATNLNARVLGWNGTGFDTGTAFNVTDGDYGVRQGDSVMKACGDTIATVYTNGWFKKCLNIQDGGCNQTSTSWNSTNNTLADYNSIFVGASKWTPALDCVDGDFVASISVNAPTSKIQYSTGRNLGNGDYLWNQFNFPATFAFPSLTSIAHNSTTIMLVVADPIAESEVYYQECSAGDGCNASINWTSHIILSENDGKTSGRYGVSIGVVNEYPVVFWSDTRYSANGVIAGTWFNASGGDWVDVLPYIEITGSNLTHAQIFPYYSDATAFPVLFWDETFNAIIVDTVDLTLESTIIIQVYDEQSSNKIDFDADIYNSTSLLEYANVGIIWEDSSVFPQGEVRLDFYNSSYYSRSRLLWIPSNASVNMKVYLINASAADVIASTFHVQTCMGIAISNATVKVERNLGGLIQTVSELKTDFNGDALVYLELNAPYYLTVTHSVYGSFFSSLNPTNTIYPIPLCDYLANYTRPFTPQVLDDVYWYLYPYSNILSNTTTNITFYVDATNDNLTYFGMNISNITNSSVYFHNETGLSGGGVLYYFFNASTQNSSSKNLSVQIWISHSPLFVWNRTLIIQDWSLLRIVGSLASAREEFLDSGMSRLGMAIVILLIATFLGAWVSKWNLVGGIIIVGIILAAFSQVFDIPEVDGGQCGVACWL